MAFGLSVKPAPPWVAELRKFSSRPEMLLTSDALMFPDLDLLTRPVMDDLSFSRRFPDHWLPPNRPALRLME